MQNELEKKFGEALYNAYKRTRDEARYNATKFLQMLHEKGGLNTARDLINSPKISEGYTALYERRRLDLTVEAIVVEDERWHVLFTAEELERAKERLAKYNYEPKMRTS